jgi:hypothetical protein
MTLAMERLMMKDAPTLAQLPKSAAAYYEESVGPGLYDYAEIGRDDAGRRVYQKYLSGEKYGDPRALLTHAEYVAAVKAAARISPSLGVQRWTGPYYRG